MIILDAIVLALQKQRGITTYFRELVNRSPALRDDTRVWVYSAIESSVEGSAGRVERKPKRLLERYRSPQGIPAGAILHSSYYRVSRSNRAINIVTVYDFIYELYASGLPRWIHSRQKGNAIRRADALICISHSTKSDLLRFYPQIAEGRIHVVHLAASDEFRPIDGGSQGGSAQPFALFVGGRAGYKNFAAAARGVAAVSGLHLTCVGGAAFDDGEQRLLAEALPGRHRHAGPVDTRELNRLYNAAFCLIYPSMCEGFGIPIVEAQRAGCPVITTRRSSMAEIAGDSAVMLKEPTADAVAEGLRALTSPEVRARYIELGHTNARQFSWDKTARETMRIYSLFS